MIVLGIDPGVSPAMALYGGPDCCQLIFPPMGVSRASKKIVNGKVKAVKRIDPDEAAILDIVERYKPDIAAVELVNLMPGQGISSGGRFMYATGLVTGLARGKGCRVVKVRPPEWQRAYGMSVGQDISREHCATLFPWMADKFAKKGSHNELDAVLIALYIWCQEMGVPVPRC